MEHKNATPEDQIKLVVDRTARKNNTENQTTNINYDQNSMSIMNKS